MNIVFHCAATVRFDEDLTKSIGMNVSGVLAIVALAKKMEKLEVGLANKEGSWGAQHIFSHFKN